MIGLFNREGFFEKLIVVIYLVGVNDDIVVLFFDLDWFKWVNDNFGYFVGD